MNVIDTKLKGVKILEPEIWGDDRGYFFESYNKQTLLSHGIDIDFIQDNEAMSSKGVLRGLHYQLGEAAQTKLVRVTKGEVLDVVVDIRPESLTYGQHLTLILSELNKKQMLVPRGFAHGYVVLSDITIFQYKCDNYYSPQNEGGIKYNDPSLAIDWILPHEDHQLSAKDLVLPLFEEHKPFV